MTFLIDENITPDVISILRNKGLSAYHVNQLKQSPKQRIIDDQLRRISMRKGYIIITRDDDFVKSFVNRKVPEKMVFVHGLDDKSILLNRINETAEQFFEYLKVHDFVEINSENVRFPFAD